MEDMSISSFAAPAASATPSGPNTALRTMAAEFRLVMTKSLAAAAAAGTHGGSPLRDQRIDPVSIEIVDRDRMAAIEQPGRDRGAP